MQNSFWRLIHLSHGQSRVSAFFVLLGTVLLLCPAAARADIYNITLINLTFTAPCIGGGTCTEVFNGSGIYDPVSNTAWNLTGAGLTGTLNASLDVYGTPPVCTAPGCLQAPLLYDAGALPGFNPIELAVILPTFDAPTPLPVPGGPGGTLLFVPGMCGGDQPACNTTGAFPGNGSTDYLLTSGTYTSVDLGPSPVPEPSSMMLLVTGVGMLGLMAWRKYYAVP